MYMHEYACIGMECICIYVIGSVWMCVNIIFCFFPRRRMENNAQAARPEPGALKWAVKNVINYSKNLSDCLETRTSMSQMTGGSISHWANAGLTLNEILWYLSPFFTYIHIQAIHTHADEYLHIQLDTNHACTYKHIHTGKNHGLEGSLGVCGRRSRDILIGQPRRQKIDHKEICALMKITSFWYLFSEYSDWT